MTDQTGAARYTTGDGTKVTFKVDADQWAQLRAHCQAADLPAYMPFRVYLRLLLDDPELEQWAIREARATAPWGGINRDKAARSFTADPGLHNELRMRAIRNRVSVQGIYQVFVARFLEDTRFRGMVLRRARDQYS